MADETVTVAQAAEMLGVSKMTVYRRIEAGEIPVVRGYKKFVRIKLSVVDDILRKIRQQNGETR